MAPSGALTRLGDLVEISKGISYQGRYLTAQGLPLVNLKCIGRGGGFRKDGLKPYSGPHKPHQMVVPGDIVVANTDLTQAGEIIGCPAVVPTLPNSDYGLISHHLCRVRPLDPAALDHRYLYYMLRAPRFRDHARSVASGTTVLGFRTADIEAFELLLPPISTQAVVGAALGAIDDLIENNRRRVDVLEEMARVIYREWFVNFRYPGHEDATFVDSPLGPIPDGWVLGLLGDVLELRYGKALKKDSRRGGSVAVVGSSGVVGWHDEELVAGPVIVVGRKGNVGSVTWVDGGAWPIDTTYFVDTKLPLRYVVEQLRRTEFLNTHAAVPGLSREQAYSRPFLQPPPPLMTAWAVVAEDLATDASALGAQSDRLALIRDLLLPKLVTGQIDVSSLDLDALVEAGAA